MHPCLVERCTGDAGNPVLVVDDKSFCDYHVAEIGEAVNELPGLYVELGEFLTESGWGSGGGFDDAKVTTSKFGAPTPMSIAARSLQDDFVVITRRAILVYHSRREQRCTVSFRGREAVVLDRQVVFVRHHLAGVVGDDAQFGLDILDAKHMARAVLGKIPFRQPLGAPCPDCNLKGLVRHDGASWVECDECGLTFHEDEYDWLAKVLIDANPGVKP